MYLESVNTQSVKTVRKKTLHLAEKWGTDFFSDPNHLYFPYLFSRGRGRILPIFFLIFIFKMETLAKFKERIILCVVL